MPKDDLSTDQAKQLSAQLFPALSYLVRLRDRMEAHAFALEDPLYKMVCEAYNAVHRISVEVHYMGCKSGVGRPEKE